ncbi:hypothetical protein [Gracilinema caldarium]|uniref:Uncharacterized protein n=1 Tax=Gracilinema caldarium (strain ATCC 51460 / DSM 7334 / H1) TaxID=744872 RepID=F8F2Z3_GRAC1|nr:hypothetical protein [Gracilinema caldarium]AEJ19901.1 hypothetical protein Spica_1759 [Gracilinema caldarium DSM 7334]
MPELKKEHPHYTYTDENGYLHISDEDASVALIKSIDLYSQRIAIYKIVDLIKETQKNDQIEIRKIEEMCKNASGSRNDFLVDELVNSYHFSVYVDSAYSMAVLGMIVPTIESLFYDIYINIGELLSNKFVELNNERMSCIKKRTIWDCHYILHKGKANKNIVDGIKQLAQITGFDGFLPSDYSEIIDALIAYRNMMFHNGLEWQNEDIEKFEQRLKSSKWSEDWFICTKRDEKPWIYYMTDKLIDRSLKFINEIEIAAGAYYIENLE